MRSGSNPTRAALRRATCPWWSSLTRRLISTCYDTPGLLATATREGRLPPVIAVFIDAWPNRAEQLGVPGGQAAWIVEKLLPTLHR